MVKVLIVLAVLAVVVLLARRLRGAGSSDPAVRAQKAAADQAVITRQGGQGMGQGGVGGGMGG